MNFVCRFNIDIIPLHTVEHNRAVVQATRRLYEQVIPSFAADLERRYGDRNDDTSSSSSTSSQQQQRPLRDSLRRVSLQWPLTPQLHAAVPPSSSSSTAASTGSNSNLASPASLTPRAAAVPATRGTHTSHAPESAFAVLRERLQSIATWRLHR